MQTSADLLGLSVEELTGALLTRPLMVARETFVKPNKVGEAQSARDALAKDVYLGIFNYLLKKINEATRLAKSPWVGGGCIDVHLDRFFAPLCCLGVRRRGILDAKAFAENMARMLTRISGGHTSPGVMASAPCRRACFTVAVVDVNGMWECVEAENEEINRAFTSLLAFVVSPRRLPSYVVT